MAYFTSSTLNLLVANNPNEREGEILNIKFKAMVAIKNLAFMREMKDYR